MAIVVTESDVGRKVRLDDNSVKVIIEVDLNSPDCPVVAGRGVFKLDGTPSYEKSANGNIVEIFD